MITVESLEYLNLPKFTVFVGRKVLHLIDNMCLGGAQRIVSDLVENNENHRLHVLRDSDVVLDGFDDFTLTESSSRFNLKCFYDVWRQLQEHEPDVVHCHLKKSKLTGMMVKIASTKDFSLVLHEHGEIWKQNEKYEFILKHADFLIDRHIAVSQHTSELLKRRAGAPEEKIEVLYNFVDTEKFSPEALNSIDPHPVADEGKFTIGYGGRLVERKGWRKVAEAAEKLGDDFQILMTGSGTGEEELKKKEDEIDNLHYLGYLEDVRTLFASIDCFVLPSEWDPSPMILYEVHSCGLPLICAEAPSIDELVENRDNGIFFQPGDSTKLVSRIEELQSDNNLRKKLRRQGLDSAEKHSFRSYEESLESLYTGLD